MQLSAHFTFAELTRTSQPFDNTPRTAHIEALRWGAVHVLQPLRDKVGRLRVTSGYRSPAVNRAVGGAATSQHARGEAADLIPLDESRDVLWQVVRDLAYERVIDQAILYEDKPHVHVSWAPGVPHGRGQTLVALAGGGYTPWSTYTGPLKQAPTPLPRTPTPSPQAPVALASEEADMAIITEEDKQRLADVAKQRAKDVLAATGEAVLDGDLDEEDATEIRSRVVDALIDVAMTGADIATPLPSPWEEASDMALEAAGERAKLAIPMLFRKLGRRLRFLATKNPRKLVRLLDDLVEEDALDNVFGNLQVPLAYAAAKRVTEIDAIYAKNSGIVFAGRQLMIDGQPYGQPRPKFKAPAA
ncbi:MAG: D-Ala-D-Ala carboxypeptidase family metallohydrolase [Myxococcota bacterium]